MRWLGDLKFRLRALLSARRMERELDEEFRFHLEMETEKRRAEGSSEEEARRQALQSFGAVTRQKNRARWSWGIGFAGDLRADLRLVGRQMRRNPAFAIGAVLTLGLGIGANTAIFSVADQALLRKPAVDEPERLAAVYTTCRRGFPKCSSSWPDFEEYRDQSTSFLDMAAYSSVPLNVGDEETARLATGFLVTGNYFGLLGTGAHQGRTLQPSDNDPAAPAQVAVLSFVFWRDAFGGDPELVGRSIRLNGIPYEVVGVAPRGFQGLNLDLDPAVWIPIRAAAAMGPAVGSAADEGAFDQRSYRWVGTLVGRLRAGSTVERAQEEMDLLAAGLGEAYPEARAAIGGPRGITVDPVEGYLLPLGSEADLRRFVFLLLGVVGLTLLLAAANLANLLLARATARGGEIGIRMAVGAGRPRVVRQLLTESAVLALVGGAAGLAVARGMLGLLGTFQLPGGVTIADLGVGLDLKVLLFTLALTAATALLFGLVPALQTTRSDLVTALRGGRSGGGHKQDRLRKWLVAVQMALCAILLVGSGLFLRTLRNGLSADLGFDQENVVAARFNLSLLRYSESQGVAFTDELLTRVRGLPDVQSASVATLVPFQGAGFRGTFAEIDGYTPAPDEEIRVDFVHVEPGYFETLGIRLFEGRPIAESDGPTSRPVMVVNRQMAERYWQDRSPIGSTVLFGGDSSFEVVGMVENPVWGSVGEDATNFVFLPLAQSPSTTTRFLTLVARTGGNERALLPAVREQFHRVDPNLSLTYLRAMDELVGDALMPQRMGMTLLSMFGVLALVLATVGIYGVVSYSVRRRARDIGIRIAVGASSGAILRGVVRGMAVPVLGGLVLGAAAALSLSRTVETFMLGVSPNDPLTFLAIAALLVLVALVATLIPARWAARLDPLSVLTVE